jgi:hypothetical protein
MFADAVKHGNEEELRELRMMMKEFGKGGGSQTKDLTDFDSLSIPSSDGEYGIMFAEEREKRREENKKRKNSRKQSTKSTNSSSAAVATARRQSLIAAGNAALATAGTMAESAPSSPQSGTSILRGKSQPRVVFANSTTITTTTDQQAKTGTGTTVGHANRRMSAPAAGRIS